MVRFKNRWLLVEITPVPSDASFPDLNPSQIWLALKLAALAHFGDAGWGALASSLTVKYYAPLTRLAIIRVARDAHREAWAALTLLRAIDGNPYRTRVVHVSGTIKHAQLAAIEHNRIAIATFRARANTPAAYHDSHTTFLTQSTREIEAMRD
ncbi:hypothetical protein PLICRDRAFT_57786 [Plicaturopsis crispa FD-325 SS-3]|uniref:Uncharacterized protein n=1 Tax=Plicaturopsis crispa FD-325 SS-3 TaxID=944288 RepID=A0A0C9T4X1_PLICR|nr:hypothetical protein PLICRDRAFT_57786 [Plicaturopsis crispa FD-325 SS-3]